MALQSDQAAEMLGLRDDFPTSVDLSSLPQESVARVAEMIRLRRERMLLDEEVWQEENKQNAADDAFTLELIKGLCEDESAARKNLERVEEKTMDRLYRTYDEQGRQFKSQDAVAFEKLRQKKLRETEDELKREQFYAFWRQHQRERANGPTESEEQHKTRTWTRTNVLLREAYKHSAPPFAGDPEEMWRRGIIVAPDMQRQELRSAKNNADLSPEARALAELNLPAYHDFAHKLRESYEKDVQRRCEMTANGQLDTPMVALSEQRRRRETASMSQKPHGSSYQHHNSSPAAGYSPAASQQRRRPLRAMSSPFETYVANYPFDAPPQ